MSIARLQEKAVHPLEDDTERSFCLCGAGGGARVYSRYARRVNELDKHWHRLRDVTIGEMLDTRLPFNRTRQIYQVACN